MSVVLCKGFYVKVRLRVCSLYVDSALHILRTLFDCSGMDRECLLFYIETVALRATTLVSP